MAEKKDHEKTDLAILRKVRRAREKRFCGNIQLNFYMGGITNISTTEIEKPPFDDAA